MTASLPAPVGPISLQVHDLLRSTEDPHNPVCTFDVLPDDPMDLDAHVALFMLHELSYSGWDGVMMPERSLAVVDATNQLNHWFETRLREVVDTSPLTDPAAVVRATIVRPGPSIPRFLAEHGSLEQIAESLVLRSPYQSKEADPHTRAIPRLQGTAKAALIAIQAGEYGVGHRFSHAELFARALDALGYDSTPATHVDVCTGPALATSNFISMAASQRHLRGALLGQLSLFEMDSVRPNESMVEACDRLDAPDDVRRFFHVHVLADDEHEDMAEEGFLRAFATDEPDQVPELIFGIQAQALIDRRHTADTLVAWHGGRSALRSSVTLDLDRCHPLLQPVG